VFLIMEDFTTSWASLLWYVITNTAIILNIAIIIFQSLDGWKSEKARLDLTMEICVHLFIFDYAVKAFTVMWCPIALFDETYMLDRLLPDPRQQKLVLQPLQTTRLQRVSYWATVPSNVIDLLSILPSLLNYVVSGMHLPLSSLRMLRLLRVIRVLRAFKAVGKWVTTLQVLGEAFYSSLGSILVLILYIALFSMVAGAILYQQEGEELERYSDVPAAMTMVAEMFVGKSYSVTTTLMSAFVLASVGMFKGIIFLLPIDKLKKATKASEERYAQLNELRAQVEEEEIFSCQPPGIEWASDFHCPAVRVLVYPDRGAETSMVPATGMMNIPIMKSERIEATLCVPLHGGAPQRCMGPNPELECFVTWEPAAVDTRGVPRGTLVVRILRGKEFAGVLGSNWRVHLEVPGNLYGDTASIVWVSCASCSGSPDPEWGDSACHPFEIKWVIHEEIKTETNDQAFQRRVLELLEDQSRRLVALEAKVEASLCH